MPHIVCKNRGRALFGLLLVVAIAGMVQAGEKVPVVTNAWVREAPPAMKVHAAYLVLMNPGTSPLSLVAVQSPHYKMSELHLSKVEGGVATMVKQDQITIPAYGKLAMVPGGFHVMLKHPTVQVRAGGTVKITLKFADGRALAFDAPVKRAADGDEMHKGMHLGEHKMN